MTWSARGTSTPVLRVPGQHRSTSAAPAVTAQGGFLLVTYKGSLNVTLVVRLLLRLMRLRRCLLHLVLDGLPTHKTLVVKDYVASTNGKFTLHVLPR